MKTLIAFYSGKVIVKDPTTNNEVELKVYKDPESDGMFAVDASFLDQVSDTIISPFNSKTKLLLQCHE